MADEYVQVGRFEEFSTRMGESFANLEKRMDQGFGHAEKAREHILAHLDQRIGGVNQRIDDLKDSLDKRLAFQSKFVVGMFLMMMAALVKYLFFSS